MNAMPSQQVTLLDTEALVAGYEELRRHVLSGHGGTGLAVLVRRGMREWMNTYSLCAAPLSTKARIPTEGELVIPQGLRAEVVLILAGMLLHGCQEARA